MERSTWLGLLPHRSSILGLAYKDWIFGCRYLIIEHRYWTWLILDYCFLFWFLSFSLFSTLSHTLHFHITPFYYNLLHLLPYLISVLIKSFKKPCSKERKDSYPCRIQWSWQLWKQYLLEWIRRTCRFLEPYRKHRICLIQIVGESTWTIPGWT